MFRRIEESARRLGATVVFVIQPSFHRQNDLIKAAAGGEVKHLLRYDDPDRFPELYEFANRRDQNHPNTAGALLFTERLAADFLALAGAERP